MTENPYENLPAQAFWSSGVAQQSPFKMEGLYRKKWAIDDKQRIATAGSCFAQNISQHLKANRFQVLDMEPAPVAILPELHRRFGFSMYSCRYGNIYTAQQLLQLTQEAAGLLQPADAIWLRDGRYYDALRPRVEPEGLDSRQEVQAHRRHHLARVLEMLQTMDLFIFTFGLTEAWTHRASGVVYPTAPGTVAGRYDAATHEFRNFRYPEIVDAFLAFRDLATSLRGGRSFRCLITVSPVPLTATASGRHVLQATTHSKSILRAVAGQLVEDYPDIDYFPSYEIITNQMARGMFYDFNMRSVNRYGVDIVMQAFFAQHEPPPEPIPPSPSGDTVDRTPMAPAATPFDDPECEDAMLEAFRK